MSRCPICNSDGECSDLCGVDTEHLHEIISELEVEVATLKQKVKEMEDYKFRYESVSK